MPERPGVEIPNDIRDPRSYLLPGLLGLLLTACSGDPGTGPIEVKWDRDVCARCNMVLSDRHHSAQVRHASTNQRRLVKKFDDLGCALLWLDRQPWAGDPGVEIWVNEHRSGDWIDARDAHYIGGQLTPMEYGLGAQNEAANGSLTFAQAKAHIRDIEQRFNAHGAHLEQAARDRSSPSIGTAGDTSR